jgi:hypothetical protein
MDLIHHRVSIATVTLTYIINALLYGAVYSLVAYSYQKLTELFVQGSLFSLTHLFGTNVTTASSVPIALRDGLFSSLSGPSSFS